MFGVFGVLGVLGNKSQRKGRDSSCGILSNSAQFREGQSKGHYLERALTLRVSIPLFVLLPKKGAMLGDGGNPRLVSVTRH